MSILEPDSVLVLGAGASTPWGLPLGGELIELIEQQIYSEFDTRGPRPNSYSTVGYAQAGLQSVIDFWKHPISTSIYKIPEMRADTYNIMEKIHNRLKGQTAETIDSLIYENRSISYPLKICISCIFLKIIYQLNEYNKIALRDLSARHVSAPTFADRFGFEKNRNLAQSQQVQSRNWIHLLINIARRSNSQTSSKIKIITFNYDTVLEKVLQLQYENIELEVGSWNDTFEIAHVHGRIGALKETLEDPASEVIQWADGINVVEENVRAENTLNERRKARQWISSARRIYVSGFSFAGPNCRLLGLDEFKKRAGLEDSSSPKTTTLIFGNYNRDEGVRLAAEKYAVGGTARHQLDVKEIPPGPGRTLSTLDLFKGGYFGEMSS